MLARRTNSRIRLQSVCIPHISFFTALALIAVVCRPTFALPATTTTLAITSGGSAVTSVSAGTVVTLTATVVSGSTPVTPGQVEFCDASAPHCTDIHQLALAQLTSNGTAIFKFRPGGGSHSYKAIFLGTKTYAGSSSSASSLDVTGPFSSVTSIQAFPARDSWTLTARVSSGISSHGSPSPSGTVSFLDTNNSNAVLATAPLYEDEERLGFANTPYSGGSGVVADFNQDGIPDVIEDAPSLTYQLDTLLGNGDGTFTPVTGSGFAGYGNSIAVADFNGDGLPDVAVASTTSNYIFVGLGNGDGTFQGPPEESMQCPNLEQYLGCNQTFVAVGDFNGDGIPDLVVTGGGFPYTVEFAEVLLGVGDGTFSGPIYLEDEYYDGHVPVFAAVGDFNGDGIADLAVAQQNPDSISIFLGKGDGTFTSGTSLTPGTTPAAIAIADLNGDGILDLAVANTGSNDVSIFMGKGDGTFTPLAQTLPAGIGPSSIVVEDFNGDGIPDLAVSNANSNVSILLGKGDGTFEAAGNRAPNSSSGWIASADFNGDGVPDLIISGAVLLTQSGHTAIARATDVRASRGGSLAEASYPGDTNFKPSVSGTANLQIQPAIMTFPNPGTQLYGAVGSFGWTAGISVTEYQLDIGTNGPGSRDVYASPILTSTGITLFSLPTNGVTLYVTIKSKIGRDWYSNSAVYTAGGSTAPPALTTPTPGSQLSGSSVTFMWTPGSGVTDYQLSVGTRRPGSDDIYASPVSTATSATATGLPTDGGTVYVALRYRMNGVWDTIPYIYTASGSTAPIALTAPAPGSQLSGSTVTFAWTPGGGVKEYKLDVGARGPGSDDIYTSPITTATSATVTGLPTDGVILYVTLHYRMEGVWKALSYAYTAAGQTSPPALTTPAPGSQLSGSSVTFQWTPGSGVKEYQLNVGRRPGSGDIFTSTVGTATSVTVTGLPTDNDILCVTLRYQIDSEWNALSYEYTAASAISTAPPSMKTPASGSQLSRSTVTFTWTPGQGVEDYQLFVGTQGSGSSDIYASPIGTATSATATGLPTDGVTLYVTLRYEIGHLWSTLSYTYTAAGQTAPPELTTPTPGSQLSSSPVTFTWTPGSGVTEYQLYIGIKNPGSSDIYASPIGTSTSATATGLPTDGVPLYVTLRYILNGAWNSIYYTYTSYGQTIPPALTTPTPGSQLSSQTVTFQWTPGKGVTEYQLYVGSKGAGSSDIYASPIGTATSATVTNLPVDGSTVYVTLRYEINGVWNALNYICIAEYSTTPVIISPPPGSVLPGSTVTFVWTAGVGIQEYDFSVTTSSGIIVYQNLNVTSVTVSGIPTDGQTISVFLSYLSDMGQPGGVNYTYTAATQ